MSVALVRRRECVPKKCGLGNLHDHGVMDIWNSNEFAKFRQVRRREVLPVCAKCDSMYLLDPKRKYL